jgi:ribonuclease P protein component
MDDTLTPPGSDMARAQARPMTARAVSSCRTLQTLTKRADFLRAAKARRVPCTAFLLQARRRDDGGAIRVGYTCSKKVGNAVSRNRAKRRLRAIARDVLPRAGLKGWDYVLVGRPGATAMHDYAAMRADLERALRKLHGPST